MFLSLSITRRFEAGKRIELAPVLRDTEETEEKKCLEKEVSFLFEYRWDASWKIVLYLREKRVATREFFLFSLSCGKKENRPRHVRGGKSKRRRRKKEEGKKFVSATASSSS